ncbi:MAG TPA: TonB-dependent receptor [Terriglobia bacterium]|nr:TonB-dependent receptor [Terriglobia bacterium]
MNFLYRRQQSSTNKLFCFASLLVMGAIFLLPAAMRGQESTAAINGTVKDSSGAVIPGASVGLRNVNTGVERTTVTNGAGNYSFVQILPGQYTLNVTKTGFQAQTQAAFTMSVNQTTTYDFTLPVGQATQTVTVQATAAKLQTGSAELGTVVNRREVNDLPLNGRNFTQMLALTPGVSTVNVSQNGGGFNTNPIGSYSFPSVNGQTNRSNMFLLDGLNDEEAFNSTYTVAPILDDIQEFKVDSHNDQAAFGGVLGGIVNVVTKSGTNQLHGTGWEYLRNNALDARNFFFQNTNTLRQNQFGGNVGGPVVIPHLYNGRNRTFFFGSYEGVRTRTGNESAYRIPTPQNLNGDFSDWVDKDGNLIPIYNPFSTRPDPSKPGSFLRDAFPNNQVPVSLMDPNTLALANLIYPAPINTGIAGTNAVNLKNKITDSDEYNLRGDEQLGQKDSFWFRYSHIHVPVTTPGNFGDTGLGDYLAHQWGANWTHTFGPTAVLDLKFGRNYGYAISDDLFPDDVAAKIIQTGNYSSTFTCGFHASRNCLVPGVGPSGYQGWGESYNATSLSDIWEWKADFTKMAGKHSLSMGVDVNRSAFISPLNGAGACYSTFQTSNLETSVGGNGMASFLLGVPDSGGERNVLEREHGGWVNGLYVQDQWRPSDRLTLNLGLRYDYTLFPIYGKGPGDPDSLVGDLDLNNGTYIMAYNAPSCIVTGKPPCIPGVGLPANVTITGHNGRIIHSTLDNIEPRFGFAYRLSNTNVLRGSFGRFFDNWAAVNQMAQNYEGTWPSTGQLLANNLNQQTPMIPAENPFLGGAAFPAPTPFQQVQWYMDPLIQNPYAWQWNFGIQHSLGQNTVLTANYAGATDIRLDEGIYSNVAVTPGPGDAAVVASRQPYPSITPTYYDRSVGKGYYHAFQFSLDRKTSKGLAFLVSYTYSKMIDFGSDGWFGVEGTSIQDPYNLKMDKGVAGFDLTHILSTSWTYELPFGRGERFQTGNKVVDAIVGPWQINGILSMQSGQPYMVTAPSGIPNTGNAGGTSERADFTGAPIEPSNQSIAEWISPAAFTNPAPFTFGNEGRNVLRRDWYRNLDLSLFRDFPISESKKLEFRMETFNTPNWVVWGQPNTSIGDPQFGVINGIGNSPRIVQFALKFYY